MDTRIAIIGIIVENTESVEGLNDVLHGFGAYIVGRMGIPLRNRKVNVISVVVDAPNDVINALSGKIGRLDGVSAKTAYSNVISESTAVI
jgi:putative iron-only hydrogenase system regulator